MIFHISAVKALEFKDRWNNEPTFRRCFKRNITTQFIEGIRGKDQVVLWVFGETGSGKSTITFELAKVKDSDFNASKVVFDNTTLKQRVSESKEGDSIVRDETTRDFGEGSGQMLATIQDLTETLRKRRNSFFLLSPVIKGVPFVNYYLEVLQSSVNLEKESIAQAIKNGLKEIVFRVGVQTPDNRYLGYILVTSKVNNPIYTEYVKHKDEFLELMAKGEKTSGLDYTAEAKKILSVINLEDYRKKGERENFIKQNTNFTTGQCKSIHIELERLLRLGDGV